MQAKPLYALNKSKQISKKEKETQESWEGKRWINEDLGELALCLSESWVSCRIAKESGSVTPKIPIPKEKEPVGSEVKAYKSGAKLVVCMLEASCDSDVLLSPLWCPCASTPQAGRMKWSLE